jgi:tRNA pseudouridine38-40 synthase
MEREIYAIDIEENDGFIQIRVRGEGFLYNMVRKIVGTLIDVGLDELDGKNIPTIINSKDRSQVSCLADAEGLFLEKVDF